MFKAINGWTKESIVDHIYLTFKGKSVIKGTDSCIYRGPGGLKCAVGLFIPKDLYSRRMETNDAKNIIRNFKLRKHMPLTVIGMHELQNTHDSYHGYNHSEPLVEILVDWVLDNVA